MKITHVYMLVGGGWAYPGRSLHPSERMLKHLAGECKTTAPRITEDRNPPIMVPMEEYDFDLDDPNAPNGEVLLLEDMRAGKSVPEGYKILCAVYPYYSKDAMIRALANSHAVNRRNKTGIFDPKVRAKAQAKADEINRKNGTGIFDPSVRAKAQARSRESQRKNGTGIYNAGVRAKALANSIETHRKNGTGVFDPRMGKKGRESQRKNGTGFFNRNLSTAAAAKSVSVNRENSTGLFDPKVRARGQAKSRESQRKNGTGFFDPKIRVAAGQKGRHARWHTNRNTPKPDCSFCQEESHAD